MVNNKIRLIIFFAVKGEKSLLHKQKQDQELTVAQVMDSFCKIQAQFEESREKQKAIQVWPKWNPIWLYSGGDK